MNLLKEIIKERRIYYYVSVYYWQFYLFKTRTILSHKILMNNTKVINLINSQWLNRGCGKVTKIVIPYPSFYFLQLVRVQDENKGNVCKFPTSFFFHQLISLYTLFY